MTAKELKTNNMGYTPYKMQADNNDPMTKNYGAVAPGKMRAFGVDQKDGPDGVSKKSGILYAQGGVGSSPNNFFGAIGNIFKKKKGKKPGGGFGNLKEMDSRITALEEGGSGGGEAAAAMTPEAAGSVVAGVGGAGAEGGSATNDLTAKPPGDPLEKMKTGFGGITSDKLQKAVTMMSDIRLKEKIEKAGKSPSGIPIYVFSYIGDNRRYEGAMAQDLISMGIDAVETQESGYYSVDYSKIDVDMKLIN